MLESGSQNHQEILTVEEQLAASIRQKDIAALARLFDDDYLFSGSNGASWGKAKAIADFQDPKFSLRHSEVHDRQVFTNGQTAIVTGVSTIDGHIGSTSLSGRYRFVRIWSKRTGEWKVLAACTNRTDS